MIDWHRPSIYERLRCFGLCRFTMGVASHNVENPPAAVAAQCVTLLLVARLKIELDIKRDEGQYTLEQQAELISRINTGHRVGICEDQRSCEEWLAGGAS